MEIKYAEWNLNARGGYGYGIPSFIPNYIKDSDIFTLVEFSQGEGWEAFKAQMIDFDLYCSPYSTNGYNQVCIGIRKTLGYKLLMVKTMDICDIEIPEFLHVGIEIDKTILNIVGIRIKTQRGVEIEEVQRGFLKEHLDTISDSILCLGDFNVTSKRLYTEFESLNVYGPRVTNGYYSFVFEKGENPKKGLDWVISKNISKVYNGYADKKNSPYATYDWSFVCPKNGYINKTEHDYLNLKGLPDHAILKGMIKI